MKNQRGFSLIEMLICLVLAAVIMAGVYRVLIGQVQVYSIQENVADAQNAARVGMEIMISDLRLAGYDKEGGGSNVAVATPVSGTANSIKVEFEQDNDTIKAVEYRFSNGQLIRNIYQNGLLAAGSPEEVLDGVTNLSFAYSTSGTKITKADVSLTVSTPRATRTLTSVVSFRNAN